MSRTATLVPTEIRSVKKADKTVQIRPEEPARSSPKNSQSGKPGAESFHPLAVDAEIGIPGS